MRLVGGALVKPGKIPAQHEEVRTHGQRQGHVVVMDNAAVRADGHVDAGLLKVFIPGSGDFNEGGSLSPSDALVSRVMQMEPPPMPTLTKSAPASARNRKPSRSTTLPAPTFTASPYWLRIQSMVFFCQQVKPSGGVNAQYVGPGLHQGGYPLGIVPGVDASAYQIPLVAVQELQGLSLWEE